MDSTVYWTKTGEKYHSNKQCKFIKNSRNIRKGDIEFAFHNGLTACTCCKPDMSTINSRVAEAESITKARLDQADKIRWFYEHNVYYEKAYNLFQEQNFIDDPKSFKDLFKSEYTQNHSSFDEACFNAISTYYSIKGRPLKIQYFEVNNEYRKFLAEQKQEEKKMHLAYVIKIIAGIAICAIAGKYLLFTNRTVVDKPSQKPSEAIPTLQSTPIATPTPIMKTNHFKVSYSINVESNDSVGNDWYIDNIVINNQPYNPGDIIILNENDIINYSARIIEYDESYPDSNTFHVNNYEVTEDDQIYGFLLGVKDINVQEVGGGRYSGNWAVLNCSIVFTPVN